MDLKGRNGAGEWWKRTFGGGKPVTHVIGLVVGNLTVFLNWGQTCLCGKFFLQTITQILCQCLDMFIFGLNDCCVLVGTKFSIVCNLS